MKVIKSNQGVAWQVEFFPCGDGVIFETLYAEG